MANLLNIELREGIKKEYRLRLALVVILLVSLCAMAGNILLLPAYLNAKSDLSTLEYEIQATKNSGLSVIDPESQDRSTVINERTEFFKKLDESAIEEYQHLIVFTNSLPELLTYSRLSFSKVTTKVSIAPKSTDHLIVSGYARTRSQLSEAINQIRELEWVDEVSFPFSSLDQAKDIDFTIDIYYDKKRIPNIVELQKYLGPNATDTDSESQTESNNEDPEEDDKSKISQSMLLPEVVTDGNFLAIFEQSSSKIEII